MTKEQAGGEGQCSQPFYTSEFTKPAKARGACLCISKVFCGFRTESGLSKRSSALGKGGPARVVGRVFLNTESIAILKNSKGADYLSVFFQTVKASFLKGERRRGKKMEKELCFKKSVFFQSGHRLRHGESEKAVSSKVRFSSIPYSPALKIRFEGMFLQTSLPSDPVFFFSCCQSLMPACSTFQLFHFPDPT